MRTRVSIDLHLQEEVKQWASVMLRWGVVNVHICEGTISAGFVTKQTAVQMFSLSKTSRLLQEVDAEPLKQIKNFQDIEFITTETSCLTFKTK